MYSPLAFVVLVVIIGSWLMYTNNKTYKQQIKLIDEDFWDYKNGPTYDQHWWRLITFRDPMKLYK